MPGSTVTTMPARSCLAAGAGQARLLVHRQADPVAEAVAEVVAVAGVGDHLAGGAVDRRRPVTPARMAPMPASWPARTTRWRSM